MRKAYVPGTPDPIAIHSLNQIFNHLQMTVSPALVKVKRTAVGEITLTALPNKAKDRYYLRKAEKEG